MCSSDLSPIGAHTSSATFVSTDSVTIAGALNLYATVTFRVAESCVYDTFDTCGASAQTVAARTDDATTNVFFITFMTAFLING